MKSLVSLVLPVMALLVMRATAIAVAPPLWIEVEEGPDTRWPVLSFDKPAGAHYFVERSDDLWRWTFMSRFWVGDGAREVLVPPFGVDQRFFRLSAHPVPVEEWVTAPVNMPLARYQIFWSEAVERPVSFHVYLPTAYTMQPQRRFPVLYWLHGAGGTTAGIPPLSHYFGDAMDAGKIPPMLVVFPNGLPLGMWCDSKDGSTPIETMLIDELVPYVDATFRTIATRDGRIVDGFSMGGYGAGRLGLKHADVFGGFSMLGAGPLQREFLVDDPNLQPLPLRQWIFDKVYGGDMEYYEAQSPWALAEQWADALPDDYPIRIIVGAEDSMLENNRALHGHFLSLGIDHDYQEVPGVGHVPLDTLEGIEPENWGFYRTVFGE